MTAFVGVEGYTLPCGYILKELCIVFPNNEFDHYLFMKPEWILSDLVRKTIRYTTQHLNNLSYEDGDVSLSQLPSILDKIKDIKVYTYGDAAVKLLQNCLPTTLIENVQDQGYKMPTQLPDSKCFRKHNSRYCAKSKALAIQDFIDNLGN